VPIRGGANPQAPILSEAGRRDESWSDKLDFKNVFILASPWSQMTEQPPLLFVLDRSKRASLQTQLAANLKRLVHTGVLRPGKAVPSSRELAQELRISRNTVVQAYDGLIGEGYLEPSARRGLYVSELLAGKNLNKSPSPDAPGPATPYRADDISESRNAPVPFRPCQPDVRLFPLRWWNRARAQALRRHGTSLLQYHSHQPLGLPALRRSLASYLQVSRGVRCDWRQIAITAGSQQALFLLAQLLLKPNDGVVMEDPGYPGALSVWQHIRAEIYPAPVDSAGMKLDSRKNLSPKLVYTTPSRQFPIGSCLSLPRRMELVEFAARKKAWIVEDDYDSEFRYSRSPLPSLHSLDSSQRVIYVGSTSKTLFPSLRVGYIVLPAALVENFAKLRAAVDEHGPLIDQATLAEFIESGAFYRHIRRSRREYALRLEMFLDSAAKFELPLSFPYTDGGMNLAGFLGGAGKDAECSRRLKEKGLDVPALSQYSLGATSPGLLFGFTAFQPKTIRKFMQLASGVFHRL
jgi:GntR family transcriptional regulator / MocR family aminotransferase